MEVKNEFKVYRSWNQKKIKLMAIVEYLILMENSIVPTVIFFGILEYLLKP